MKKTFLLLTILLTTNFVFAYTDCRDNGFVGGCTLEQLVTLCQFAPTSNADRASACKNAVEKINFKILELTSREGIGQDTTNGNSAACQKITNKMWLKTARVNDSQVNGDVSRIQKFFKRIGIINWDGDGEFGTWDRAAVWKFQQQYMPEISPTGDVGVKTMAKINSMICSSSVVKNDNNIKWNFTWKLTPVNDAPGIGISLTNVLLTMWGGNNDKNKEVSFVIDNSCQIQYATNAENGGIGPWLFCNGKHEFEKYAVFWEGGNYVIKHAVESGKDGSMPYQFFKQITFYN